MNILSRSLIYNFLLTAFLSLYVLDPIFLHIGSPRSLSIFIFFVMVIYLVKDSFVSYDKLLVYSLIFYVITVVFSVNFNYSAGVETAAQIVYYGFVFIVLYHYARHTDLLLCLRYLIYIAGTILIISFLLQSGSAVGRVAMHPGGNPSHFAGYLALMVILVYSIISIDKGSKDKFFLIIYGFLFFIILIATQGFNALLGLIVAFSVFAVISNFGSVFLNGAIKKSYLILFLLLVPFLFFLFTQFEFVINFIENQGFRMRKFERIFDSGQTDVASVTSGRSDLFFVYMNAIFENGFGNGLGSSNQIIESKVSAHNYYITVLFEQGILSFFALLLFFAIFLYRSYVTSSGPIFVMLICLLFMMAGNDMLYYKYGWFYLFVAACLLGHSKTENGVYN